MTISRKIIPLDDQLEQDLLQAAQVTEFFVKSESSRNRKFHEIFSYFQDDQARPSSSTPARGSSMTSIASKSLLMLSPDHSLSMNSLLKTPKKTTPIKSLKDHMSEESIDEHMSAR